MMRRHPFSRPTSYTHQLGTGAILVAVAAYVALFIGFMFGLTRHMILW